MSFRFLRSRQACVRSAQRRAIFIRTALPGFSNRADKLNNRKSLAVARSRKSDRRMAAAAHLPLSIHLRGVSAAPPLLPLRAVTFPSLLSSHPSRFGSSFAPIKRRSELRRRSHPHFAYMNCRSINAGQTERSECGGAGLKFILLL